MSNGEDLIKAHEMYACRDKVEAKLLLLETQVLQKVTTLESTVEKLVTRMEFEPYKMVTLGLVGGVLIAALGAVMSKVIGW
jgi:hypothetical protein